MSLRRLAIVVLLGLAVFGCSRDPHIVKRKYLENGNRYFERGKFKEASIMYRKALQKDALYGEAYYRLGLTDVRMGRMQEAARNFRRAVDTQPNHIDAKVNLGDLYLVFYLTDQKKNAKLADQIEELADQLLARDPKLVTGLRLKGYVLLLRDKNPKGAVEVFRRANDISPLKPEIALPLAQSLIASGDAAGAEKLAFALIEKEKSFGPIYDLLYMDYMRSNRPAEAEQILKRKIANNPKVADYHFQLALHYYGTKRPGEIAGVLAGVATNRKEFPDGRHRVGAFYFSIRDFDAAIQHYEKGVTEDPGRKADYQKSIAEVLLAQGKRPQAQQLLEEVRKQFPKDERAKAMWASLLIESGNPQQLQTAVNELQAAVGQTPTNPVLRYNLARALLASRQTEQAKVQLQEAMRLQKNYLPPRLLLAQMYLYRYEFGHALQQSRDILDIDPGNLPAKLIRTTALASMGNRDQSRRDLEATLKEHPNSKEAVIQLALLDLGEKRFKEAESVFTKLHDQSPGDLRGLMGLTETYAAQGQFDKAMDLLRKELAKTPDRSQIRLALGNLAFRSSKYDLAIEQFQLLIQRDPNAGDLYLRLGESYRRKGQFDPAIRAYEKARELRPNDPAAHLQLALLLDGSGDKAKARPIYEQILKMQPDNPVALNNLAYMIAESGGDLDQALTLARRAKDKWPNDHNVADTLGWIYIKKGLSDSAADIFRDLVAKQPEVSTFRYHLAMALYQKGDNAAAKRELQIALQKKPSKAEEAQIRELMSRLG